MSEAGGRLQPPDQRERQRALDSSRSILVQAPAGSGKTDLLARRYLRLLAEVDAPDEIVAITFTNAAAAEMRHRILGELERAAAGCELAESEEENDPGEFTMPALARRALDHSRAAHWDLLEVPSQLRISTIDSFCRDLALQQPLLSTLGGGLGVDEQPRDLYRRAARRTLQAIDGPDAALGTALSSLLLWCDNNWSDLEYLLVKMLEQRDRWMQGFVLEREQDWDALRERLERPFANAVRGAFATIVHLLDQVSGAREEALELARFACVQSNGRLHRDLAEMAEFPRGPHASDADLDEARQSYACLADLVLTRDGAFRKRIDKTCGFPA
ncbi:MAG TPA: UvrD-helicase domain-containing protein, partial [Terracidiphilus sp.]|nr:UvrD-helicase domain-containing protein [Terracidiphilus sp.]